MWQSVQRVDAKENRLRRVAQVVIAIAIIVALVAATAFLFPAVFTRFTAAVSGNKIQQEQNHAASQGVASTTTPTTPALPATTYRAFLKDLTQFTDLQDWGPGGATEGKTIRLRGWRLPEDWPGPRRIIIEQDGSEEDHKKGKNGQIRSIMFCPETAPTCQVLGMGSSQFAGRFDKVLPWNGDWFKIEIQGSSTDIPGLSLQLTRTTKR